MQIQKEKKKRKVYQRKFKDVERKYKELEARAANLVPAGMGVPLPAGAKYVIIQEDGTQQAVAPGTPGAVVVDSEGKTLQMAAPGTVFVGGAAGGAVSRVKLVREAFVSDVVSCQPAPPPPPGGAGGPPPPPPPPGGAGGPPPPPPPPGGPGGPPVRARPESATRVADSQHFCSRRRRRRVCRARRRRRVAWARLANRPRSRST